MESIDSRMYQAQAPYPWTNPEGLLTCEGYQHLLETLPDVYQFEQRFGDNRKFGQKSHDRFTLQYHDGLRLSEPWQEFISELQGKEYASFICRLLGVRSIQLNFHWHYTPNGCSVSPHCDAKRKLGSHIFYFNTSHDWDPDWGGETLILDDGGRFDRKSAPKFEDFDQVIPSVALGNRSLIFSRKNNSWHGVRVIQCPENFLRKVFIVVLNQSSVHQKMLSAMFGKYASSY